MNTVTEELILELRIEDYSRLNDIRKHKIENLEQRLRAHGQSQSRFKIDMRSSSQRESKQCRSQRWRQCVQRFHLWRHII